jgi:hypothetical protein
VFDVIFKSGWKTEGISKVSRLSPETQTVLPSTTHFSTASALFVSTTLHQSITADEITNLDANLFFILTPSFFHSYHCAQP